MHTTSWLIALLISVVSAQDAFLMNSWESQVTLPLSGCFLQVREYVNFNMGSLSSKVFTKFNRKIPAVYLSDGYARISNVTAVTPTDGATITSAKVVSAGSDIGTIEIAFFTDRFPLNSVVLDISYVVQGPMWTVGDKNWVYWSWIWDTAVPLIQFSMNLPQSYNLNPSDIIVPNQHISVSIMIPSGTFVNVTNKGGIPANKYYFINTTFPERADGCRIATGLSVGDTVAVSVVTIVVPILIIIVVIIIIIIAVRCYFVQKNKKERAMAPALVSVQTSVVSQDISAPKGEEKQTFL